MKIFSKIIYNLTLSMVFILVIFPVGFILQLIRLFQGKDRASGAVSYFEDVSAGAETIMSRSFGIRIYSLAASVVWFCLQPNRWISAGWQKTLFAPKQRGYRLTPNQAAALVVDQVVSSVRNTSQISEQLNARYIFALQPTLFETGAITEDDKKLIQKRGESKVWGFPYFDFFKVYYAQLRSVFMNDKILMSKFHDVSKIFVKKNEQRFIDVAHMGNPGQKELAESLANKILEKNK